MGERTVQRPPKDVDFVKTVEELLNRSPPSAMIKHVSHGARATLAIACGLHFLHDGFSEIVYVLLPVWTRELSLALGQAGLLRTAYTGGMALFQLPAGLLAERWGERRLLAAGTAVTALGFITAGGAAGWLSLLGLLLAAGLGSGVQHPLASALVSRAWEEGPRRAALGSYNFSGDLGKMAAPAALALGIAALGWRPAVVAGGVVGLLGAALIAALLPSGRIPAAGAAGRSESARERSAWGIRDARGFRALAAIGMIDTATRSGFLIFLPFALMAKGASVAGVGGAFAVLFAGGALGKVTCGLVAERLGIIRTVILTEAATAIGIAMVAAASGPVALAVLFPLGIALNGTSSVLYGSVAELVLPERRSRAYGLYYTLSVGTSALAPTVFGAIGDLIGVAPGMILVALCVLVTIPLSLVMRPAVDAPAVA
jgi:MFS transporter, FSR family, fosmidomycin resistance protein